MLHPCGGGEPTVAPPASELGLRPALRLRARASLERNRLRWRRFRFQSRLCGREGPDSPREPTCGTTDTVRVAGRRRIRHRPRRNKEVRPGTDGATRVLSCTCIANGAPRTHPNACEDDGWVRGACSFTWPEVLLGNGPSRWLHHAWCSGVAHGVGCKRAVP